MSWSVKDLSPWTHLLTLSLYIKNLLRLSFIHTRVLTVALRDPRCRSPFIPYFLWHKVYRSPTLPVDLTQWILPRGYNLGPSYFYYTEPSIAEPSTTEPLTVFKPTTIFQQLSKATIIRSSCSVLSAFLKRHRDSLPHLILSQQRPTEP